MNILSAFAALIPSHLTMWKTVDILGASLLQVDALSSFRGWAIGLLALAIEALLLLLAYRLTRSGATWRQLLNQPVTGIVFGWAMLWLVGALALLANPAMQGSARAQDSAPQMPAFAEESTPASPEEAALAIMVRNGCGACHLIEGTDNMVGQIGPELSHVGTVASEHLALPEYTGSAEDVPGYIRESILQPAVFLVPGYDALMPTTFESTLSSEDLETLVDYLSSLK